MCMRVNMCICTYVRRDDAQFHHRKLIERRLSFIDVLSETKGDALRNMLAYVTSAFCVQLHDLVQQSLPLRGDKTWTGTLGARV